MTGYGMPTSEMDFSISEEDDANASSSVLFQKYLRPQRMPSAHLMIILADRFGEAHQLAECGAIL